MKKKNWNKWLLLTWKKVLFIVIAWIVAIVLHNLVYALFIILFGENFWIGGDEPFFFILAIIVIPAYFVICVVYSLIKRFKRK